MSDVTYSTEEINEAMAVGMKGFMHGVHERLYVFDPFMALAMGDWDDPERKELEDERAKIDFLIESHARFGVGDSDLNEMQEAFRIRERAFMDRIKRERAGKKLA